MSVKPYDIRTFTELLGDLRNEQLVVPNFQRDFEWERAKQRRLAASVLCGLPIGGMVMFSGHSTNFAHRGLCATDPVARHREEVTYLLDGQQRLATLRSLFDDPFGDHSDWTEAWRYLHSPLQTRWFLTLRVLEGVPQCFGSRTDDGMPALSYSPAVSLPLEPSDLLSRIQAKRVLKRDAVRNTPWWHPAYQIQSGLSSRRRRQQIAQEAAKEEAIPLWEVANAPQVKRNDMTPLHELAIRQIALSLEKELRLRLDEDPRDEMVLAAAEQAEPALREELSTKEDIERWLPTTSSTWVSKVVQAVEQLMELQIPTITVSGDLRRAVTIFENINEGGTPLTVFDLVNAKAVPGFYTAPSLRSRVRSELGGTRPFEVPEGIASLVPPQYTPEVAGALVTGVSTTTLPAHIRNQYLNLLSIYGHEQDPRSCDTELRVEYIKKEKQLALTADQINGKTDTACRGLFRACLFMQACAGRIKPDTSSYALLLLPLAVTLAEDGLFGQASVWAKLEYWYWVSLLGGRYRERQNEAAARDIGKVYKWCVGKSENPYQQFASRVLAEPRYSDKDTFLFANAADPVPRAVGDGLLEFTLSRRPRDFLPEDWGGVMLTAARGRAEERVTTRDGKGEERQYRMELVVHHIVPLASATKIDESSAQLRKKKESLYNSPLNKTRISKFANDKVGGLSPRRYFEEMPKAVLRRHHVGLEGGQIMKTIAEDDPFGDPAREKGIRSVLGDRFDVIKSDVEARLDELEDQMKT